ncbi:unnamed protein product [Euphydryas editha]|uniref:Endonuclease/exonuclease/phosphatase domain-containing protein n=1 Tax=Euphydryas editha TaxID=104508 RepID=A0AAU9UKV6_EUPED|nr:unnamed protein product [Euphydryas editha]
MSLPSFNIIAPQAPTHFLANYQPDTLDIAVLKDVTLQLRTIVTLSELDSDHCPVLIQLGPQLDLPHPTRVVLDWKKLDTELQSIDSPILSGIPDDIESVVVGKTASDFLFRQLL